MVVSIVHDDTDSVKLQIKQLRENLSHVEPRVEFKSCCVWEFSTSTFDETSAVLLLLSKRSVAFRKVFFDSLVEQTGSRTKCCACLVIETEGNTTEEDFESVVGKDCLAVVDNLDDTFKWLPKVCAFLFKKRGNKNKRSCVIPKLVVDSKSSMLRESLMQSFRDIKVSTLEEFNELTLGCCILITKEGNDAMSEALEKKMNSFRNNGGTTIGYCWLSSNNNLEHFPNRVTYGKNSVVPFIIHVLFVLEFIYVKTVLGRRLLKVKKPLQTPVDPADISRTERLRRPVVVTIDTSRKARSCDDRDDWWNLLCFPFVLVYAVIGVCLIVILSPFICIYCLVKYCFEQK